MERKKEEEKQRLNTEQKMERKAHQALLDGVHKPRQLLTISSSSGSDRLVRLVCMWMSCTSNKTKNQKNTHTHTPLYTPHSDQGDRYKSAASEEEGDGDMEQELLEHLSPEDKATLKAAGALSSYTDGNERGSEVGGASSSSGSVSGNKKRKLLREQRQQDKEEHKRRVEEHREKKRARSGNRASGKKSAQSQLIDLLKEQQQRRAAREERMLALQEREAALFERLMDRVAPPRGGQSE